MKRIIAALNNPQFVAVARHLLTAVMTVLATLGVISASQSADLVDAMIKIGTAVGQIGAAAAAIVGILGPLYAALSASDKNQIKRVEEIAANPESPKSEAATTALVNATASIAAGPVGSQSTEAKAAILTAAASIPEVDKVVAPAIAPIVPSDKVVSQ